MGKGKLEIAKTISVRNKKASFEYEFLDEYTAGLQLKGTEIKSIRMGKVSLQEAYCFMQKGELWIKGMHIAPYELSTYYNHEPTRTRKLLLNKKELKKLENKLKEQGLTIVPKRIFINGRGLAKLDIALAKGKKLYDKREDIKKKDTKRDLQQLKLA